MNPNNIFDEIQQRMISKDIRESFAKKKYNITEITFLEFVDDKVSIKIITSDGNKIVVEKDQSKINWKLNAMPMGEVMGKELADVVFSYDYEKAKDK